MTAPTLVVLEGDQTGQELLLEALRVLDPSVIGFALDFERYDLSLTNRRATENRVVFDAAEAMLASRTRPQSGNDNAGDKGDVGSPNRILREAIGASVIVRTGRRLPRIRPVGGIHAPISVVRMAVGDAYGAKEWRSGEGVDEIAVPHRNDLAPRLPQRRRVRVRARREERRDGLRRTEIYG